MRIKKKDTVVFLLATFTLIVIWVIDSVIPSSVIITSIYAVPLLVASYQFNIVIISFFTIATIIVYSLQADFKHFSHINIFLHDLALVIISLLIFQLIRQKIKAERLKDKAENAEKQLEIFMNTISHDLMQPMTIIKIYSSMLADIKNKNKEFIINKLISSIDVLEHLILDLRDTAYIKSGKMKMNMNIMDFSALIKDVAEQQQITTIKHEIVLDVPKRILGIWDKDRLKQLFTNLISNAIKYSPRGGKIMIKVIKEKTDLIIAITDNGIGITVQQYKTLFQPFVRFYKGKKPIKGMGLGLYICKSIVESHRGKIWITSSKGKGSTFFVKLPMTKIFN